MNMPSALYILTHLISQQPWELLFLLLLKKVHQRDTTESVRTESRLEPSLSILLRLK